MKRWMGLQVGKVSEASIGRGRSISDSLMLKLKLTRGQSARLK